MRRRRATVATPGEWQYGVWRLAVANGPNVFQMLLVTIAYADFVAAGDVMVNALPCDSCHSTARQ